MAELRYTKDGVPIYDGSPEQFVAFQRAALIYAETVEWKKRNLVGPRLQAALEGSAKMVVEHKAPGWISHPDGASQLLACLKQQVRAPTLAEAGRTMSRFFYGIKRRRGEGMSGWIVRHDEALLEAKRTLAEAIQEYGPEAKQDYVSRTTSWRTSGKSRSAGSSERGAPDEEPLEETIEEAHEEEEEGPEGSRASETWADQWWSSGWDAWDWDRRSQSEGQWGRSSHHGASSRVSWDASEAASAQADKFLPDFVIAWLLLQRSGLDATEKSVIVANLRNNFTITKVKDALKLTWPDEELRKRDSSKNSAMFAADEGAFMTEDYEHEEAEVPDWENPEEGFAYQALEDDAQEALAALDDARRTLKDAREKQAQMRRNRNFFPNKNNSEQTTQGGGQSEQRVHFVFSATDATTAAEPDGNKATQEAEENLMALHEILNSGHAIIDGGATSSLGSEEAVQKVAEMNWQATGEDPIEILPDEQPAFRFGNNAQHRCMSTALVKLPSQQMNSRMRIHVHDIPGQPVLLSVKSLRALGAVIDFSNNQAVFKSLNAAAVVDLETTESGHQLFPLTRDVLQGSTPLSQPFTTFKQFAQNTCRGDAAE
ncbi:hypothetical protein AK812_SmicGene5400 [Symbiodinium microadriaticum]|uniref:Uncharacterized protein n=1 Tax=Symbiodinium microadriaticum TaxID=2951 RepID=A0A1Q9ETX6_SYMMI|nr:hypothetical protein AK812_SmicGene5400 [Symbiodinium microadriaticum]